jgi:hypothetical protein
VGIAKTANSKISSALVFLAGLLMLPSFCLATDSDYVPPHPLTEDNPVSVHEFIYHIKPDTEPVGILMKDVTFSIPRNYLASLYKVRPYTPVSFTVMTFYPDFAGSKVEDEGAGRMTEQMKIWRFGLSPNLIEIVGLGHDDPEQDRNNPNEIVFKAESNGPDYPWKYGLLKSTKSPAAKVEDIYFQRPSASDPGAVIFCPNRNPDDDAVGCKVYMRITPHVEIYYHFHPQLMPHWQEINQKVTRLVQSFIVKKEK